MSVSKIVITDKIFFANEKYVQLSQRKKERNLLIGNGISTIKIRTYVYRHFVREVLQGKLPYKTGYLMCYFNGSTFVLRSDFWRMHAIELTTDELIKLVKVFNFLLDVELDMNGDMRYKEHFDAMYHNHESIYKLPVYLGRVISISPEYEEEFWNQWRKEVFKHYLTGWVE